MFENKKILRLKFVFFDIVSALLVWLLFMVFRRLNNDFSLLDGFDVFIPYRAYYISFLLFPLLCVSTHYLTGYYLNPIKISRLSNLSKTIISSFVITFIVFFLLILDDIVVSYQYYYQSFLILFLLMIVIVGLFRFIQTRTILTNFKTKKWTIKTLIIGTGVNAQNIADGMEQKSIYNTLVGFIKSNGDDVLVDKNRIIGKFRSIEKIIKQKDIEEVIVALDNTDDVKIFEMINRLFQHDINIKLSPRLYQLLIGRTKIDKYGINPLINLTDPTMSDWEFCIKRTFDFFISLMALLFLFPILIIIGIIIKIDSKGSIIFKQERIGRGGKPFWIYKFRTMYLDSEKDKPRLSTPNDSRITTFGHFLRKYRLDETPQFVNILLGQMSIVGPRPERKFYINKIVQEAPYYFLLYRISPGLTSWGPIKIGYASTVKQMIERLNYDVVYMENMTLSMDLKIILSTIEVIFKGKGV
ncbi:MAG: hypothetical protein CR965_00725 [Paludibacter sp.]|nr:MAG: hypothetical protein CR965_00725 [Paludibacter sp.]